MAARHTSSVYKSVDTAYGNHITVNVYTICQDTLYVLMQVVSCLISHAMLIHAVATVFMLIHVCKQVT